MQRKVLVNKQKREALIRSAISQYRSPEQWLNANAKLSFSPASYQPNRVERTIRERLQDFQERAQEQDVIKTVRSHVSAKEVVDRLYYNSGNKNSQMDMDSSQIYRHLSYTPKRLHISAQDIEQDISKRTPAVPAFTMTTSTMNLESLVSFDKNAPGLFKPDAPAPPSSRPTRVHFFPDISDKRGS